MTLKYLKNINLVFELAIAGFKLKYRFTTKKLQLCVPGLNKKISKILTNEPDP